MGIPFERIKKVYEEMGKKWECTECEKCVKHCNWCEHNKGYKTDSGCNLEFTTCDARTCDKYCPDMGDGVCIKEDVDNG